MDVIWEKIPYQAKINIMKSYFLEFKENAVIDENTTTKVFEIENLDIDCCDKISSFEWLNRFTKLKSIYLSMTLSGEIWSNPYYRTPKVEFDLENLKEIKGLKKIWTSIIDIKSFKPIQNLNLEILHCASIKATDFEYLASITTMKELYLNDTNLDSVKYFSEMEELQILHIQGTKVKSLEPLIHLTNLKEIICHSAQISEIDYNYFNTFNLSEIFTFDGQI